MADGSNTLTDTLNVEERARDLAMGTAQLPGRETLDRDTLRALSVRSDWPGLMHLAGHVLAILIGGYLVHVARGSWMTLIPAMILHGFTIATLFAAMHECVHRTAFKSRWLNRVMGWIAGAGAFYNSDYYRRYHHWHHRYTQDPEHDPELVRPKPRTWSEYLVVLSGVFFWRDKTRDMFNVGLGRTAHLPFVPESAHQTLAWSMRAQLALYGLIAGVAIAFQSPAPLVYWLFPAMLAQPLLRSITFAEHTGCHLGSNGLTNTRTTLTWWPVRFFMWNMPYHAEHHLFPSIPFHALPRAHDRLRERLAHLDNGYVSVHRQFHQRLSDNASTAG